MHRSGRVLCRALAIVAALYPFTVSASSLWFGDKDGLHQIETATNQIVLNVPFEPAAAIAVNGADGSVWVLTQSRLARLDRQGFVTFQRALRDFGNGLGAPRLLAFNPNDTSVWAGFENRLIHLSGDGVVLHNLSLSVQDLAVGQDGSAWILSQSFLQQRDASGTVLKNVPLTGSMQKVKFLALDDTGGALWLAGEKSLFKQSLSAPDQTLHSLVATESISAITVDMQTGDLWVLGQNGLFRWGRDGTPLGSHDLRDFSIANPNSLIFDFSSQSAWVGHQQGLSRISVQGTLIATFPATPNVGAIAIGATPVNITPVVSIVSPTDGALLTTATPTLRVKYDALCGAASCGFPNSFFSNFSLIAFLNGTQVGSLFVFDPATGGAFFTPGTPLPQGLNTFSAQARDNFGGLSDTVSISFSIDSIAPAFQNVAPPSGSVFTSLNNAITITGNVDDPTATVMLGAQIQGPTFSFTVLLNDGLNNFTLIGRDPAGNTSTFPLTYTYSPPPNTLPTVSLKSPLNNTEFSAPSSIKVTADAADADGTVQRVEFLRNGVVEATDTTAPYAATLLNVPAGTQTLAARAVDNRNGTATSAVTVRVIANSITITSPAPNASIAGDSVLVTGRIVALGNSGVTVNNTVAAIDAVGNFTVLVSLVAGPNTLEAILFTEDGTQLTANVSVTATGVASPFAVVPSPSFGLAPLAIIVRITNPTGTNALVTYDGAGPFSLPAGTSLNLSITYPAGVFVPTVIIFNTAGQQLATHRFVIDSRDPARLDAMFRAMWNGMNNALATGDKDGAMRYLNDSAKAKYGPVFDALMPFMSQIVASYSSLAQSSITANMGEYAVSRMDNGAKRLYMIYFLPDVTGVWRIDEM